ncbi:hypothetical protein EV194_11331 [Natronoflexus pectinivorans]|uniref:Uncharacterized protein n=1 Tax=Natronoflexus pectinivorans TaxID=682526 RepID=A0A4R2GDI2_9BACT|nr:hypothetical protein EV194_11331 [Natronoflexus pectinivorans]
MFFGVPEVSGRVSCHHSLDKYADFNAIVDYSCIKIVR